MAPKLPDWVMRCARGRIWGDFGSLRGGWDVPRAEKALLEWVRRFQRKRCRWLAGWLVSRLLVRPLSPTMLCGSRCFDIDRSRRVRHPEELNDKVESAVRSVQGEADELSG